MDQSHTNPSDADFIEERPPHPAIEFHRCTSQRRTGFLDVNAASSVVLR
jgi:hypothetical protein